MNIPKLLLVLLALACATWTLPGHARPAPPGAVQIVREYVIDLQGGNVQGLRAGLKSDDPRNDGRARLFASSGYGQKLRAAYLNSTYQVVDTEHVGNDTAHVDVRILLDGDHPLHVRFVVEGNPVDGFMIVDEI
jgi:hypothetical protein